MLDKIQSYFGLTTMPFGRALAPGMLFRSGDHAQAAARIGYGIATRGITVITGEVGVGKTVAARAAINRAEPARHHLIYLPDPTVGARGIYHRIVSALGGRPSFHNAALVPQARDALAAEAAERGRVPILSTRHTFCPTMPSKPYGCSPTTDLTPNRLSPQSFSANPHSPPKWPWASWPHSNNESRCAAL